MPSEAEVRQRLDRLNQQHSAPPGGGGTDNIPADQASVGGRGQGRQPVSFNTIVCTNLTLNSNPVLMVNFVFYAAWTKLTLNSSIVVTRPGQISSATYYFRLV